MKTNTVVRNKVRTHEGGMARVEKPLFELRRTLSTCMLFENTFYEGGESIAERLAMLAGQIGKGDLITEIQRAKHDLKLRHAPLWMARWLTNYHQGRDVGDCIESVITRADELAEFMAMYWHDGKTPISKQAKRGLRNAFKKFDEYQFAKYDRDTVVKLRDVMFLTHPKPEDEDLFKRIADRTLETPDTWEVALSAEGVDKKEVWTRLLNEKKLGALALLRNLRNMTEAEVDRKLVMDALINARTGKILPFQFVSAWKYAPAFARGIESAMLKGLDNYDRLPGSTAVLIDVSGSMYGYPISGKSKMDRSDASGALALALNSLSDDARIFTFSHDLVEVPNTVGFALIESIHKSQGHGGTWMWKAIGDLADKIKGFDRLVVITDEQAHDSDRGIPVEVGRKYILNVAPYQFGVMADGGWTRINGFSTAVVDWIMEEERNPLYD